MDKTSSQDLTFMRPPRGHGTTEIDHTASPVVAFNWANALSLLRLGLVAPITAAALFEHRAAFVVLLLLAGATDIFDGVIARSTSMGSAAGAAIDSAVDSAVLVGMAVWAWLLDQALFRAFWWGIAPLVALQTVALGAMLCRQRVVRGLHLWSGKIGLTLGYLLLVLIGLERTPAWFVEIVLATGTLATLEALAYLGKGGRSPDARSFLDP